MADALLSPAVGGTMWAASAAAIGYSAKRVREEGDDGKVPLMGVLGAFIFAAQMINFSIPATGSSGHLGGGMILAALLGPHAACLVMASVLTVQALFFADGGLLALGCNIFNLGFLPAFVAYPLVFRPIAGKAQDGGRIAAACVLSAVVGLQLGSLGVVLETAASGISELPLGTFAAVMQPIHLAIGIVEGLATAAVVAFVRKAHPSVAESRAAGSAHAQKARRKMLAGFALAAALLGGVLSWYASSDPDGLEWAIAKVTGRDELDPAGRGLHGTLAEIQELTSLLPDYGFRKKAGPAIPENVPERGEQSPVDPGTTLSGLVGGIVTLAVAALAGLLLRRGRKR